MYDEDEQDWSEGLDMEQTKPSGDGIKVEINQSAMERIESAAVVGIRQELSRRLDKVISETIEGLVEEKLSEVIGKMAEAAITEYLTRPRKRTNHYGEEVGGTSMTLSEMIPDKVKTYMEERVGKDGQRADQYARNGSPTRTDWIVGKFVRDELDVATKQAASEVSEQAKKVVAAHVGRFVAEQMIPQIEVSARQ